MKLQFSDDESYDWYRVWNFANRGQTLHVVVESCARTHLAERQQEFTYARDDNSLTVFARTQDVLEQLIARLRIANSTFDGALLLVDTISEAVRYE